MAYGREEASMLDVIVSRLEVEARELTALAWMVQEGHVKTPRDLRENYVPHRLKALERITEPRKAVG